MMYNPFMTAALVAAAVSVVDAAAIAINVGVKGALTFEPEQVTAKVGDTLEFHFFTGSGAHSVVAGNFDSPCNPSANGFFSGFVPGDSAGATTFIVTVNSTDPIYFYCHLNRHCQNGMVGVVNPAQGQTLAAYKAAAQSAVKAAPAAPQGGVLTSFAAGASPTEAPTTAAGGSTARTTAVGTTASGSSAGSETGAGRGSATGSATGTAATATPTNSVGGRKDELSIVLGLAVILGGLVALMS